MTYAHDLDLQSKAHAYDPCKTFHSLSLSIWRFLLLFVFGFQPREGVMQAEKE